MGMGIRGEMICIFVAGCVILRYEKGYFGIVFVPYGDVLRFPDSGESDGGENCGFRLYDGYGGVDGVSAVVYYQ